MRNISTLLYMLFFLCLTQCKVYKTKNTNQSVVWKEGINYLNILCGDSCKYWILGRSAGEVYCKQGYFIEFVYDSMGRRFFHSHGDFIWDTIGFTFKKDTLLTESGDKWLIISTNEDSLVLKNFGPAYYVDTITYYKAKDQTTPIKYPRKWAHEANED